MKQAILIGTNHYDPLGRQKIHNVLLHLKNERNFIPDFIAVEWKEEYARQIILQRPRYEQLLSSKFPLLSSESILTLADSLAYEADSHNNLYPETPIIWLDENRVPVKDAVIENYAETTLNVQISNLSDAKISDPCNLQQFSFAAYHASDKDCLRDTERDAKFLQATCASAFQTSNIIGILGSLHTDLTVPGGYARLLLDVGYNVESIRVDVPE